MTKTLKNTQILIKFSLSFSFPSTLGTRWSPSLRDRGRRDEVLKGTQGSVKDEEGDVTGSHGRGLPMKSRSCGCLLCLGTWSG